MILPPLNDHACLAPITDVARTVVASNDPELFALARKLGTMPALIRWLRSLPQRDDTGDPDDGPRIDACDPPQRLRIDATDPNCVERTFRLLTVGEIIDPEPRRRMATIDTPVGRHTLPVENDRPVVLDPRVPRNCAQSGIDALIAQPVPSDLAGCASWVCGVAAEPADALPGGTRRVRNARAALAAAARGVPIGSGVVDDVAMVLALAAREAPQWGPAGAAVVERVAQAMVDLERACGCRGVADGPPPPRNAVELRVGRYRLRPHLPKGLAAALRALGVVGLEAGTAMARVKLAALGITPPMLDVVETELQKDGLTLGSLAKPVPPKHSIAALTTDALVARHLERAGAA